MTTTPLYRKVLDHFQTTNYTSLAINVYYKGTPVHIDLTKDLRVGKFALFFSLFLLSIPIIYLISLLLDPTMVWTNVKLAITCIALAIPLRISFYLIYGTLLRLIIIFDKDSVETKHYTPLQGVQRKKIKYSAFKAVHFKEILIKERRRSGKHSYTVEIPYQLVELVHQDNALSLPVFFERGENNLPASRKQSLVQFFGLPAFEDDGHNLIPLRVEEIGLPLKQRSHVLNRATSQKSWGNNSWGAKQVGNMQGGETQESASILEDIPLHEIPEELEIHKETQSRQEHLNIKILSSRFDSTYLYIFPPILTFLLVMNLFGDSDQSATPGFTVLLTAILLMLAGTIWVDGKYKRKITLSRSELIIKDPFFALLALLGIGGQSNVKRIPLDEIQHIRTRKRGKKEYIEISYKTKRCSIGQGLSIKTLKWLHYYLKSAVINA